MTCSPFHAGLAATNKCLAQSNKSRTGAKRLRTMAARRLRDAIPRISQRQAQAREMDMRLALMPMRQSPRFPAGFFGACTAIPSERDRRFQRQIENEGQMQLMCPSEIKARQSAKIRQLAEAAKLIGLPNARRTSRGFRYSPQHRL